MHGPCEHAYAALILKGLISVASGPRDARIGTAACLAPTLAISRMVPKASTRRSRTAQGSDAPANAESQISDLGDGQSHALVQLLQAAGISRPSALHRLQENEATLEALAHADITSMMGIFGFKFAEAVRVQQCARQIISTSMGDVPQLEERAPHGSTSSAGAQVILITAASPSSWAGQVSGTVHASYDGKRPLCSNKELKHVMVVTRTAGFKPCAHASGKCSAVLRSLGM